MGDELTPSHLFVLNEPMHHIEEIKARIAHFDGQLLAGMAEQHNALALLETIPGIDLIGATMLLVEISIYVDASGKPDRLPRGSAFGQAITNRQDNAIMTRRQRQPLRATPAL